jgi:type I restriction enzyme S subunit
MQDLLTKGIDEKGQIRSEETHKFKDSPLGRLPEEWEVAKLGTIGEITSSKRVYFKEYVEEGIPFYRSKEIIEKAQNLDVKKVLFIPEDKYKQIELKYGVPKKGDVLITAVGTLGIIYIIKEEDCKFYFKDGNLLWIKDPDESMIDVEFLFHAFEPVFTKQRDVMIIGTSQNALTIEKMKCLQLPLPPLPEQHRIASVLSQIDEVIEKEEQYKVKLERIKQGLMQDLLTGEVRVNHLIKET